MSYDLFFKPKIGRKAPSKRDLQSYFSGRKHYEVSETQAVYNNEDTGVYFIFELEAGLAFSLNYFRPHVFGLEAEPEVAAFLTRFDLDFEDPQVNGMGDGPYSREEFLRGWNAGNELGVRAILSQHPEMIGEVHALPHARVEAVWRWNLTCEERNAQLGAQAYVPRISFVARGSDLLSYVAWTDASPARLPVVDVAVLVSIDPEFRSERNPPRAPGGEQEAPEVRALAWREIEQHVSRFPMVRDPLPHRVLDYDYTQPPANLVAIFKSGSPRKPDFKGVRFDQILDAEVVERARAPR